MFSTPSVRNSSSPYGTLAMLVNATVPSSIHSWTRPALRSSWKSSSARTAFTVPPEKWPRREEKEGRGEGEGEKGRGGGGVGGGRGVEGAEGKGEQEGAGADAGEAAPAAVLHCLPPAPAPCPPSPSLPTPHSSHAALFLTMSAASPV